MNNCQNLKLSGICKNEATLYIIDGNGRKRHLCKSCFDNRKAAMSKVRNGK